MAGEPLTPKEETTFRESVRAIAAAMPDDYSLQWSNHVAERLLATLDAQRRTDASENEQERESAYSHGYGDGLAAGKR